MKKDKKLLYINIALNLALILISIWNGFTIFYIDDPSIFIFAPIMAVFFMPIVAAIIVIINDLRKSLLCLVGDFLITAIFIQNIFVLFIIVLFTTVIGFIIGSVIKNKKNIGVSTFIISIAYIISQYVMLTLYITMILKIKIQKYSEFINKNISKVLENFYDNLTDMGTYSKEYIDAIKIPMSQDSFLQGYLLMVLVISILAAVIYYVITNNIVKLFGYEGVRVKVFSTWYISNLLIAGLILIGCIGLILKFYGINFGNFVYINARFIAENLLIINGITFGYYFLIWKVKQPKIHALILMIVSSMFFTSFIIGIGFLEVIMDLRKLDPNRIFKKKSELK